MEGERVREARYTGPSRDRAEKSYPGFIVADGQMHRLAINVETVREICRIGMYGWAAGRGLKKQRVGHGYLVTSL